MAKRTQGERAGLTRERVLDAAVELVDQRGLRALSMRKLGAALGVEAMTLYYYFPSKDALLDGLVEWVIEHSAPVPDKTGLAWDAAMRRHAETLRSTLLAHPGVLPLFFTRPAVTPQTLQAVERALRTLCDAGFPLVTAQDLINAVTIFTVGHAMSEAGAAALRARINAPSAALATLDLSELPLIAKVAASGRRIDEQNRFLLGLDALLAGFATRRAAPARRRSDRAHRASDG